MDEVEVISQLIGGIYDAALDPTLWLSVLERTCAFVNGQTAALMAQWPVQGKAQFYFEWGTEPRFLESYNETYGKINPAQVPAMTYSKVGEIHAASDHVPFDELRASRFYKEWLAPQGIIDVMYVLFEKSAVSYSALAFHRSERHGLVDSEAKRRLGLVAPHFRRAVAIAKIVELHKFQAAALADSLDGLATAMFLVDARGHLVHSNAAGYAMLDKGDVIRAADGRFAAVDAKAHRALQDVLVEAEQGDPAASTKGIDVPLASRDDDRHVAHVLPLTSGARRQAGTAYSAVAAVFVRKAELELPHPLETIANVFKLTPAEMRVLMMLVQLGGVPEVAPVLGISEPTVRTHLQHIFDKTNTSRQADLVKLVAGYMSPLRHGS
jgi:DNA-binding CsgD family transcriptional regulator